MDVIWRQRYSIEHSKIEEKRKKEKKKISEKANFMCVSVNIVHASKNQKLLERKQIIIPKMMEK